MAHPPLLRWGGTERLVCAECWSFWWSSFLNSFLEGVHLFNHSKKLKSLLNEKLTESSRKFNKYVLFWGFFKFRSWVERFLKPPAGLDSQLSAVVLAPVHIFLFPCRTWKSKPVSWPNQIRVGYQEKTDRNISPIRRSVKSGFCHTRSPGCTTATVLSCCQQNTFWFQSLSRWIHGLAGDVALEWLVESQGTLPG